MKTVVIESPLSGDVEANIAYAKQCVRDSLARNEAPYAAHLFFAQPGILNDLITTERKLGIEAGIAWGSSADTVAAYIDHGISLGMRIGIAAAIKRGSRVEFRQLTDRPLTQHDRDYVTIIEARGQSLSLADPDRETARRLWTDRVVELAVAWRERPTRHGLDLLEEAVDELNGCHVRQSNTKGESNGDAAGNQTAARVGSTGADQRSNDIAARKDSTRSPGEWGQADTSQDGSAIANLANDSPTGPTDGGSDLSDAVIDRLISDSDDGDLPVRVEIVRHRGYPTAFLVSSSDTELANLFAAEPTPSDRYLVDAMNLAPRLASEVKLLRSVVTLMLEQDACELAAGNNAIKQKLRIET